LPDAAQSPGETLKCFAGRLETYAFWRARSFAICENEIVGAIVLLKFDRILPLAKGFAERPAGIYSSNVEMFSADAVVPVPLHREREKERGYDQAGLLSKPPAKILRLLHRDVCLRGRSPQELPLTLHERWVVARGDFEIRPGSQVDNLRVLLLDDVMTTGATLDACSKALRDAGAKSVVALTVARAAHNPLPGAGES